METRQFLTTPSRQIEDLIGVAQFNFSHHQWSIAAGKHIQNPSSAWKI
jgi:hypothetical protein